MALVFFPTLKSYIDPGDYRVIRVILLMWWSADTVEELDAKTQVGNYPEHL